MPCTIGQARRYKRVKQLACRLERRKMMKLGMALIVLGVGVLVGASM